MATRRTDSKRRTRKPAITPEARESQLVSKAMDLAEQQLEDGTASAQVITHYLKLGTAREELEREKLRRDNDLLAAKAEQLASAKRVEELYDEAIRAMRAYSGQDIGEDDYDQDLF